MNALHGRSRYSAAVKIYRYWCRANAHPRGWEGPIEVFDGSDISEGAARGAAERRAQAVTEAFDAGPARDAYTYGDRPAREEIVREVVPGATVITRCAYGALILNTDRVMFLDIDTERQEKRVNPQTLLSRIFGSGAAGPDPLEPLRAHAAQHPSFGVRVYRTCNGFRGLVTSDTADPQSLASETFLNAMGCDPLFVRLCRVQSCYRARLTAKPWRCGVEKPWIRFPFRSEGEEASYRRWEEDYHTVADQLAACAFVEQIGHPDVAPDVRAVLALHDELACLEGADLA